MLLTAGGAEERMTGETTLLVVSTGGVKTGVGVGSGVSGVSGSGVGVSSSSTGVEEDAMTGPAVVDVTGTSTVKLMVGTAELTGLLELGEGTAEVAGLLELGEGTGTELEATTTGLEDSTGLLLVAGLGGRERGGTPLSGGLQSKSTWWMPISQSSSLSCFGSSNRTRLAPPHWLFSTVEPPALQEAVCLQVEPSSIS